MLEYKQSVAAKVPVRLQDSSGAAVTAVTYSSVTATLYKADGTTSAVVMNASNWTEITAGAFSGTGTYQLSLAAGDLNVAGEFMYAISATGASTYIGVLKIVANEEVDTYTVASGLRADYTTARAVKMDNLDAAISTRAAETSITTLSSSVERVIKINEGRWKIFSSGPDINRLVLYDADGTTVLQKWDLLDKNGSPTTTNPQERVPLLSIP